jgi:hypothetical protein
MLNSGKIISQSFNHQVHDVKIINSYRSDHCPIILQLKLNDFILDRGLRKFKNSRLFPNVAEKNILILVEEKKIIRFRVFVI